MNSKIKLAGIGVFATLLLSGCVWENVRKPWVPHVSTQTNDLSAVFTDRNIDNANSKHWDTVDYVLVPFNTVEKGNLYEDGYLNMTGMYDGAGSFNPALKLKASYNNDHIFILAEWNDKTANARNENLYFNGREDELKPFSDTGWTSQGNTDNLTISFFNKSNVNGDAWKWGTAYSAPVAKAIDMTISDGNYTYDEGNFWLKRNSNSSGGRAVPLYEWNGETQEVVFDNGSKAFLDPAYFLLDQHKMIIEGDAKKGRKAFENSCGAQACHGAKGSGEGGGNVYGPPIDEIEYNRYSRQALHDAIIDDGHDGASYYKKLSEEQRLNLLAAMRSVCGFPGYYIESPKGSVADVSAISNINASKVSNRNFTGYKVLFVRSLTTADITDISFSSNTELTLNVRLSDNDDINALISDNFKLIIK
ncbi:MAG: hypothetical protein JXQ87_07530 [Bacteroidia bacterium]